MPALARKPVPEKGPTDRGPPSALEIYRAYIETNPKITLSQKRELSLGAVEFVSSPLKGKQATYGCEFARFMVREKDQEFERRFVSLFVDVLTELGWVYYYHDPAARDASSGNHFLVAASGEQLSFHLAGVHGVTAFNIVREIVIDESERSRLLEHASESLQEAEQASKILLLETEAKELTGLLVARFGINPERAEHFSALILKEAFSAAGLGTTVPPTSHAAAPTIPATLPPKYEGKAESGEIYAFLQRVYSPEPGREPLTLEWLHEYDPIAYRAYYNRQRTAEPPPELANLARRTGNEFLERYGLRLDTPDGKAEARRVMNVINATLYPRKNEI